MKLYFIRSSGEKKLVKEGVKPEAAIKEIEAYTHSLNPNYKIYYYRSWYSEDHKGTMYDVGSHTEFFVLGE